MDLKIGCVEASEQPAAAPPPAKVVEVYIGKSGPNKKCVQAEFPVKCDADAANFGKRLNNHGARDTWEITVDGSQVCARRTDNNVLGWGMDLKIGCVDASEQPAAPQSAKVVKVYIGKSGPNKKCVQSEFPLQCDADAANFGKRLNNHGARDTWEITVDGSRVCARRTDNDLLGWGMDLMIGCVKASEQAKEED